MTNYPMIRAAARYAESLPGAHTVHVQALRDGLVLDVAEFRTDWGEGRPEGIHDWLCGLPSADSVKVAAMRPTGELRGCDEEYETTAEQTFA